MAPTLSPAVVAVDACETDRLRRALLDALDEFIVNRIENAPVPNWVIVAHDYAETA